MIIFINKISVQKSGNETAQNHVRYIDSVQHVEYHYSPEGCHAGAAQKDWFE